MKRSRLARRGRDDIQRLAGFSRDSCVQFELCEYLLVQRPNFLPLGLRQRRVRARGLTNRMNLLNMRFNALDIHLSHLNALAIGVQVRRLGNPEVLNGNE